eukprot:4667126-Pyramimonas_sp.AAC.3
MSRSWLARSTSFCFTRLKTMSPTILVMNDPDTPSSCVGKHHDLDAVSKIWMLHPLEDDVAH